MKHVSIFISCSALAVLFFAAASAQKIPVENIIIHGRITYLQHDSTRVPLKNALIKTPYSGIDVRTDESGVFAIDLSKRRFSYPDSINIHLTYMAKGVGHNSYKRDGVITDIYDPFFWTAEQFKVSKSDNKFIELTVKREAVTDFPPDQVFKQVDEMPAFPVVSGGMTKFMQDNLKYPAAAAKNHIEGTVDLNFLVSKEGKISDIQVQRGLEGGCTEEAIRVLKMMPDWKPGEQYGKKVAVRTHLPFKFHPPALLSGTVYGLRFNIIKTPLANATVRTGSCITKSDSSGNFKMDISQCINNNNDSINIDCNCGNYNFKEAKLAQNNINHAEIILTSIEKAATWADRKPQFPGGELEQRKYIKDHFQYPEPAIENGTQGTVDVRFIVGIDGKISDVKVKKAVTNGCWVVPIKDGCPEEAIRLVEAMPSWIPGSEKGETVPVYASVQIDFRNPPKGVKDTASGRIILPFIYDYVTPFGDAFVIAKKQLYGLADRNGKVIIPMQYRAISPDNCKNYTALVMQNDTDTKGKPCIKYGCMDQKGRFIVLPEYDRYDRLSGTMEYYIKSEKNYQQLELIDVNKGKRILSFQYDSIMPYRAGLAAVRKNGKWGFVDSSNKVIIPFEYDECYYGGFYQNGIATVRLNGQDFEIDKADHRTIYCFYNRYAPVYGADHRNYINECFARKIGVTVIGTGNCPTSSNQDADTLKWPIKGKYYFGGSRWDGWRDERKWKREPKVIRTLSDRTYLLQDAEDSTYFRGFCEFDMTVCLPPYVLIATPTGDKLIKDLKEGDDVWTMNAEGKRVAAPILKKSVIQVPASHKVLRILLEDGRQLEASPLHPAANYIALERFTECNELDGSKIVAIELIPYSGMQTQDILPAGETGCYWANGVLIGSTLKENYRVLK